MSRTINPQSVSYQLWLMICEHQKLNRQLHLMMLNQSKMTTHFAEAFEEADRELRILQGVEKRKEKEKMKGKKK